jgi:Fic family protein
MLRGVALTARSQIALIKALRDLMQATRERLQTELPKTYSQELLNNLFRHPYTKIEFVERDLGVSRITAARHLGLLAEKGFVKKQKSGRANFYINQPLFDLLSTITLPDE